MEPSDADLSVAARLYESGIGSAITDNDAEGLFVVVEPPKPRVVQPLEIDRLEALIGPTGPLVQEHATYEDRPGQRAMLRRVAETYNGGGVTLVEAGTGTGKSLAYLIPSAEWALQNAERTVISTNTINLQEQLDGKDLPLVRKLVGEEVDWELVKGRGNYISIRRAMLAAESAPLLFPDDRADELDGLLDWIGRTEDGSRADFTFVPSEDVWDEVKSDADICLRARCPHFQACFYQRSRRRAAAATLLITNHHLLFTDLSVRIATQNYKGPAVLPAYRHVVLDEAHNLEDAATSHLGREVTRRGMFRMLARLDRRGRGVLTAVQEALAGRTEREPAMELRSRIEERVRPALEEARAQLTLFLRLAGAASAARRDGRSADRYRRDARARVPPRRTGALRWGHHGVSSTGAEAARCAGAPGGPRHVGRGVGRTPPGFTERRRPAEGLGPHAEYRSRCRGWRRTLRALVGVAGQGSGKEPESRDRLRTHRSG